MNPLFVVAAIFAVALGLPFSLYAILTRGRRRSMREIRLAAHERGWRYRLRRWQGDPTAFRIDGCFRNGLTWIVRSQGTRGYDRSWTVTLGLVFPTLGGEVDFSVMPREAGTNLAAVPIGEASSKIQAGVRTFSGILASELEFFRNAKEFPSGLPEFDTAYRILALPQQFRESPLNAVLGSQILRWPTGAISPHSLLGWRDPFGVHVKARLLAPANWATVSHLIFVAEELSTRLPGPLPSRAPRTFLDRVFVRLMD